MKKIVFATGNANKVKEANRLLAGAYPVVSLADIGCREELPETQDTIEGNALQKARYVRDHYGADCFAEDTGLEVDALDGAPGVYSARYAGPERDSDANIDRLLRELDGKTDRRARFRTVIALLLDGREMTFEGIVEGHITEKRQGAGGFGYDPVFIPEGRQRSFAEMNADEKNAISHRGRAVRKLMDFLRENLG